jgi:hypothetical protein
MILVLSQFTGKVARARADYYNLPVISEGNYGSMVVDENSLANSLTLHATGQDGLTLTWTILSVASYGNTIGEVVPAVPKPF